MIAYLEGIVKDISINEVIILVNGVGYLIYCSNNTIDKLPAIGQSCEIYVKTIVREDCFDLYGFIDKDEKQLFNLLTNVNGVGNKTAMAMLGALNTNDLKRAIANADISVLSSCPGIGKKTAERIVLELKEKLKDEIQILSNTQTNSTVKLNNSLEKEAVFALNALGYSSKEAGYAVKMAMDSSQNLADIGDIVKEALKIMSKLWG